MSSTPATLNAAQWRAVNHVHGPCLVLAGAGSGKTRVITYKIARLLQDGLPARRIAAITFTNKAAAEMRERARTLAGRGARELTVSTFHALGMRLLREDGQALGLKPRFSILDADDALGILRDAGGTTDARQARQWQWAISAWKNQGLDGAAAARAAQADDEHLAARVMQRYEERLLAYQAVDFDDLIGLPVALLTRHAEVRAKWQALLAHVLVDEVQDTNAQQYALLRLLVGERAMFTAVGDDDQSIYGWRGATLDNLRSLPRDYPALEVIKLEQNYRSTGAILRAANHVIAANPKLFEKTLWSELGEGEPVRVQPADHEEHEADRIVARIQALREAGDSQGPVAFGDVAVLYRANHQARALEQALRRAQVPYKVSGGQSFFDRAEIRDLCAWMRLLVNEDDDPAFLRAITTPRRGIGHQTLAQLGEFAARWKVSLFAALFADSLQAVLPARALGGLQEFGRQLNDLQHRARHTTGAEAARALLLSWLKDLAYEQHLHDHAEHVKGAQERWSNVLDFVEWIAKRCGGDEAGFDAAPVPAKAVSVLDVAQTINVIVSLAERGDTRDVVTLSTLHAAKGLEWPHVILAGINEGLLPFASDDEPVTPERLEEERRLMYVGITRAQRTLVVSTLKARKRGRERKPAQPSRFIAEMKLEAPGAQRQDPKARLAAIRAALAAKAVGEAPTPAGAEG